MQTAAFDYIRGMVQQQAAIIIEPGKEYLAENRLTGFAKDSGFTGIESLVEAMRGKPFGELHRKVIDLMTTNETSFFRDIRPFDALRKIIIPELLAKRPNRGLQIWCAASSSGQEPYSLAMLIRDHFPAIAPKTRILASDISREMLARTDAGVYSQFEVNRGLPAPALAKHFVARGGDWAVKPELRAMLDIREINLATAFPPMLSGFDLLLVRNVLIYFTAAVKQDILVRMRRTLSSDGVLLLGGAETTLGIDAGFERVAADKASYYRPVRSA